MLTFYINSTNLEGLGSLLEFGWFGSTYILGALLCVQIPAVCRVQARLGTVDGKEGAEDKLC